MIYINPDLGQYLSANNISRYASYDGDGETLSPWEIHALYQEHEEEALEILSQLPNSEIRNIIFSCNPQGDYIFRYSERDKILGSFTGVGRPETNQPEIPEGGISFTSLPNSAYNNYYQSLQNLNFEEALIYFDSFFENGVLTMQNARSGIFGVEISVEEYIRALSQALSAGQEEAYMKGLTGLKTIYEKISWSGIRQEIRQNLLDSGLKFYQDLDLTHARAVFMTLADLDPHSRGGQIAAQYLDPSPVVSVFSALGDEFRMQRLFNYHPEVDPPLEESRDEKIDEFLADHAEKVMNEQESDLAELKNYVLAFIDSRPTVLDLLGINDLSNLNPQQAALLASKIVMEALDYNFALAVDTTPEFMGRIEDPNLREQIQANPELVGQMEDEYDNLSVLSLLREGSGVCRHYAKAVGVIFEIIKALYPNANLECSYIFPVGAIMDPIQGAGHEWNMLFTRTSYGWEIAALDSTAADEGNGLEALDDLDPSGAGLNSIILWAITLFGNQRIDVQTYEQLMRFSYERAPNGPFAPQTLLSLGQGYLENGSPLPALEYFIKIVDLYPDSPFAEYIKPKILELVEDFEGELPEDIREFLEDHNLLGDQP